ncbi:Guanine nucleotide exchange factor (GEF) which may activate RAB8A and RAB8B [Modicella reniformis]|uniref:Guanine nucleotide exchange factor (GEF) which may activate RAB8A and RAB8B n=1 Tax=Modicella reniformis TaxID=1440133 RepID=A0A9P6J4L0_9FUNG|nr:Guanine nucleotide exchange factor (GEF) which may activate RAB8A and RAB8B [Modicella reniformis]
MTAARDSFNSTTTCVDYPSLASLKTKRASLCISTTTPIIPKTKRASLSLATPTTAISEYFADYLFAKCQDMANQQKGPCRPEPNEIIDGQGDDMEMDQGDADESEREFIPWLQEAIQTISVLESRLVELEEDCKSIPLYEQDRTEMIQVIQDLDSHVRQDRVWIEDTEKSVRWTAFVLEEALLSTSIPATNRPTKALRRSSKSGDSSTEKEDLFDRKSCTEGMLPTLVAPTEASTEATRSSMDNHGGAIQFDRSCEMQGLEAVYRNAIQTALRHLRTIEHSSSTIGRQTARTGDNANNDKVLDRLNRRKSSVLPNEALKEWLENASMMSPVSSKTIEVETDIDDDNFYDDFDYDYDYGDDGDYIFEDDGEDNGGENEDNVEKEAILDMYLDNKVDQEDEESSHHPQNDNNQQRHGPEITSAVKVKSRRSSVQPAGPTLSQLHQSSHPSRPATSSRILQELSASSTSFQATISSSTLSLKTDLGVCLLDERIYLKQQIQAIDMLRLQEQERHQKAEQAHQQLIADLMRFSKELLQNANELTCAQAALGDASEITLMTLKNTTGDSSASLQEGALTDSAKRKRMVAVSYRGMTDSVAMVEQGIKRMRTLAADCVGITELAQNQNSNTDKAQDTASTVLAPSPIVDSAVPSQTGEPSIPKPLSIQTADLQGCQSNPSAPIISVPSTPLAMKVPSSPLDHKSMVPSSSFVDGVAFQEFEAHLVSLRTGVDSISKRIQRRMSQRKSFTAASGVLPSPSPSPSPSADPVSFLKRVLAEDIYPCLLIHPGSTSVKQNGWMSSFLSSSAGPPPSTYDSIPQTPWRQRLLKALENNACEIESWKMTPPTSANPGPTPTTPKPTALTDIAITAPTASCCLCGISRSCEFRLRIVERDGNNTDKATSSVEPHPLDRFCRDRIVAVCDFYTFLAHLRQGLLDRQSNLELFRRALWLRQRIGCARIGSMDIVQASLDTTQRRCSVAVATSLATVHE